MYAPFLYAMVYEREKVNLCRSKRSYAFFVRSFGYALFILKGVFMIIDVTGIELTPGNRGKDCLGNGTHFDEDGELVECCCDECDYMKCCFVEYQVEKCSTCHVSECPRKYMLEDTQKFGEEYKGASYWDDDEN